MHPNKLVVLQSEHEQHKGSPFLSKCAVAMVEFPDINTKVGIVELYILLLLTKSKGAQLILFDKVIELFLPILRIPVALINRMLNGRQLLNRT